MRVWIDVREACKPRKTGKGQWTLRATEALLERADVRATLLTDCRVPDGWMRKPGFERAMRVSGRGFAWHLNAWRAAKRHRTEIDAYLSPTSFIVPFLLGRAIPTVIVVHDLIAFRDEPHDAKALFIERMTLPRALSAAAGVCCVSEATAEALRARFPTAKGTFVVGAGPTAGEPRSWTGSGDHVLCVGTLCPRKNQLRLIEAFARMDPFATPVRLLLVGGRGWDDDAIVRRAKDTHGVEWLGFQDDATLAKLLRECRAFASVSEEEGFGLPVLDALRVGAPVLASDIPTAREVAGDCATYVDPSDIHDIARGLEHVLSVPPPPTADVDARIAGFTWEATAERLAEACARAVDKRP